MAALSGELRARLQPSRRPCVRRGQEGHARHRPGDLCPPGRGRRGGDGLHHAGPGRGERPAGLPVLAARVLARHLGRQVAGGPRPRREQRPAPGALPRGRTDRGHVSRTAVGGPLQPRQRSTPPERRSATSTSPARRGASASGPRSRPGESSCRASEARASPQTPWWSTSRAVRSSTRCPASSQPVASGARVGRSPPGPGRGMFIFRDAEERVVRIDFASGERKVVAGTGAVVGERISAR